MKMNPPSISKTSLLKSFAVAVAALAAAVNGASADVLDITNNAVIARGASIGTPTAGVYDPVFSPTTGRYSGVEGLIQTGFWNDGTTLSVGPGINSSLVAFEINTNSNYLYAVGALDNNSPFGTLYGVGGGIADNFAGVYNLTGPEILIKYTYAGDADLNGVVDGTDYSFLDTGFNGGLSGWFNGDFNHDGVVDGTDYGFIDTGFNGQGAPLSVVGETGLQAQPVPEPGTGAVALVVGRELANGFAMG